jgi:hypothetical protein
MNSPGSKSDFRLGANVNRGPVRSVRAASILRHPNFHRIRGNGHGATWESIQKVAWIFQILDLIVSLQKDALDIAGIVHGLTRNWRPNFSWLPPRSFVIPWPRSGKMVDMAVNFAPLLLFLPYPL